MADAAFNLGALLGSNPATQSNFCLAINNAEEVCPGFVIEMTTIGLGVLKGEKPGPPDNEMKDALLVFVKTLLQCPELTVEQSELLINAIRNMESDLCQ